MVAEACLWQSRESLTVDVDAHFVYLSATIDRKFDLHSVFADTYDAVDCKVGLGHVDHCRGETDVPVDVAVVAVVEVSVFDRGATNREVTI